MENDEKEEKLNRILKDLFNNFCHECFEEMCNQALSSIHRFKIEKEKSASCYLMFLHEKILNTEIECKNRGKGCMERIMFGELDHHLRECQYSNNSGKYSNFLGLGMGIGGINPNPNIGIGLSNNNNKLKFQNFPSLGIKSSKLSITNTTTIQINNESQNIDSSIQIKRDTTNTNHSNQNGFSISEPNLTSEIFRPYKDLIITSSSASIVNGVTTGMNSIYPNTPLSNTDVAFTNTKNKKHNKKKKKK